MVRMSSRRIQQYYAKELMDYIIYSRISEKIKDKKRKMRILKLAEMEKKHAEFWKKVAERRKIRVKDKTSKLKIWFFMILSSISLTWTAKILELLENKAIKDYYSIYENKELDKEELDSLKKIIEDELFHEIEMIDIEKKESNFIDHIRDVFLGMNDGLVEILSALAGLVSLYPNDPLLIGITGTIVGLSGTLSMAIGTYISVKNQKDVKEKGNFEYHVAKQLNIRTNLKYEEITENPLKAGYLTGIFYIIGTALVVYPFFLGIAPKIAILISALTAVITWIIAGFIIAISSGISIKGKILEMLLTGLGAAVVTYSFGYIINYLTGGVV